MKSIIKVCVWILIVVVPIIIFTFNIGNVKHHLYDTFQNNVSINKKSSEFNDFISRQRSRETESFGEYKNKQLSSEGKHYGIDYGVPEDTKVKAVTHGTVTRTFDNEFGGKVLQIAEANGQYHQWYMHLNKYKVKVGDTVKPGDVIALSGNTGKQTTGPHVHFQRMKNGVGNKYAEDPKPFIDKLPDKERSIYEL